MTKPVENRIHPEWSDEEIARVMELLAAGKTVTAIAGVIGRTRGSVMGKIKRMPALRDMPDRNRGRGHRSGEPSRTRSDKGTRRGRRLKPAGHKAKPTAEVVQLPAPVSSAASYDASCPGITLLELTSKTCCWPLGDPREESFRFCGHVSLDSRPYCAHHTERATRQIVCAEAEAA